MATLRGALRIKRHAGFTACQYSRSCNDGSAAGVRGRLFADAVAERITLFPDLTAEIRAYVVAASVRTPALEELARRLRKPRGKVTRTEAAQAKATPAAAPRATAAPPAATPDTPPPPPSPMQDKAA